ncbi:MAG: hypothetical protein ACRDG4_09090, partial [Chloroflexota bacterium]
TIGVASEVISYVSVPFSGAIKSVAELITRQSPAKSLNTGYAGPSEAEPLLTQAISYISVLLILFGLPLGLWQLWRRHRRRAVPLVLALAAVAYPASLILRFTQGGTEISSRSSESLFLGIAFVLALGCRYVWTRRNAPRRWAGFFTAWAAIIFLGGLIIGWGPSARLPGPYLVGADSRSIENESVDAALWARAHIAPTTRVLTDRTNRQLMGAYGDLDPQVGDAGGYSVSLVFFSPRFGKVAREVIRADAIRYLIVDRRLSEGLPIVGVYFGPEPGAYAHKKPIPLPWLTKFAQVQGISTIFDSGNIVMYDVGVTGDCSRMVDGHSRCMDK